MPHHHETRWVPYSQEEMFALVAAVEHYPEFLPWCLEAKIQTKRKGQMSADLTVGNKILRETFTSHVMFRAPSEITVAYGGGALKRLNNLWRFEKAPQGGSVIHFEVDFALKSSLLNVLMEAFFEKAFRHITKAFETRARDLYGER